jgi:hypothetical protein
MYQLQLFVDAIGFGWCFIRMVFLDKKAQNKKIFCMDSYWNFIMY